MPKIRYRLKGHESFIPREGWITKGLRAVEDDPKLYATASGADALGMGTNMAKAVRYWMRAAGLTSESSTYGVKLTDMGKIILEEDLYLEDIFTLWILHANIVLNFGQATSWNLFFNHMDVSSFTRIEMIGMLTDLLRQKTGENKLSERSIRDDCAAILSMYTESEDNGKDPEDKKQSPFSMLGLLIEENDIYYRNRPSMTVLDPLLLLYLIKMHMKNVDTSDKKKSILIDTLTDGENMPGKVYGLNRIMINDLLDELQRDGYIIVNRTAGLDIVYLEKELSENDILREHYKRRGTDL